MYNDKRSKKIILVSHCIMNQNSISDGTADYAGTFTEILDFLIKQNIGILQIPCPELLCLGLDRGDVNGAKRSVLEENTRIRTELLKEDNLIKINKISEDIYFQINEYLKNDFEIIGCIGVDRSPSCGILTTSKNNEEIEGKGVFMENLEHILKTNDININFIGIKTSDLIYSMNNIKKIFGENV